MHPDTYNVLRKAADTVRAQLSDCVPAWTLKAGIELAHAESLLAAHEAQTAATPTRWATIHVMGHERFTGIVTPIPGGYRIAWLDSDTASETTTEPKVRLKDVYALHSVDWLTEAQYDAYKANLRCSMEQRAECHRRRTTWPAGYRHAVATHPERLERFAHHAVIRDSDGAAFGFYEFKSEAQEAAWRGFDNDLSDAEKLDPDDDGHAVAATTEALAAGEAADKGIPF